MYMDLAGGDLLISVQIDDSGYRVWVANIVKLCRILPKFSTPHRTKDPLGGDADE